MRRERAWGDHLGLTPEAPPLPRPSTRLATTTRHQRKLVVKVKTGTASRQRKLVVASRKLVVASRKLTMRRPNVYVEIGAFPSFFHIGLWAEVDELPKRMNRIAVA